MHGTTIKKIVGNKLLYLVNEFDSPRQVHIGLSPISLGNLIGVKTLFKKRGHNSSKRQYCTTVNSCSSTKRSRH